MGNPQISRVILINTRWCVCLCVARCTLAISLLVFEVGYCTFS